MIAANVVDEIHAFAGTDRGAHLMSVLERLASLMSEAILREFPASSVRLRLRKLTPPGGLVGVPGVELTRTR